MEWFPALRKRLAARGVHLPDPYPYTARTFKGSVLATLLAAILFLIAYAVWEAASYTARNVQRTAFITIETTAATSRLVTEKAGQAVEALFPKPAPVTEASLESILPPGSHLGNQMKDAIRQNTLPYQEGSGTLTDAARQIDFALLQTVLRLKLDKGRILLLNNEGGEEFYFNQVWKDEASDLHTCARHHTKAEGWVRECGFRYLSAHNPEELDAAVEEFFDDDAEGPVLLEVFSEMSADSKLVYDVFDMTRPRDAQSEAIRKSKELIKATIGQEKAQKIAGIFKR